MRILWIDDQAANKEDEWKSIEIKEADKVTFSMKDHDVKFAENFICAWDKINNQLNKYDYIIIDINLSATLPKGNPVVINLIKKYHYVLPKFIGDRIHAIPDDVFLNTGFEKNPDPQILSEAYVKQFDDAARKDPKIVEQVLKATTNAWDSAIKQFGERAGFHLYIKLLECGFPKERIVFYSAYAEGSKEDFVSAFREASRQFYMALPEVILKNEDNNESQFNKWLIDNLKRPETSAEIYDYLTLRRGMMDVIDDLENNKVQVKTYWDGDIDKGALFDRLRFILDTDRMPDEKQMNNACLAVAGAIAEPFDKFKFDDLKSGTMSCWQVPLYFLRNWTSHGVLRKNNTELEVIDVAFLFALFIKEIFDSYILDKPSAFSELLCKYKQKIPANISLPEIISKILSLYQTNEPLLQIHQKGFIRRAVFMNSAEDFRKHLYASYFVTRFQIYQKYVQAMPNLVPNSDDLYYCVANLSTFIPKDHDEVRMCKAAINRLYDIGALK